jgi:hypothetical protein
MMKNDFARNAWQGIQSQRHISARMHALPTS